ncbi:MAG: biotin--[acetyl-CoA-carboxylase] ligase [Deltaproteobacteria bacterium]|nr:biotin--[acetyl-CoA-carboxylase] ligase [Deltaproteobacteria bacterium]TLN01671.1 MAG: biotin--[acetyl-CoA-carboxylase] ligase [bacterium]
MLELFRGRNEQVISGEELGTALKVSRTAVWKHVKNLLSQGYQIESIPSRGYRFLAAPDVLTSLEVTSGLQTTRIGCQISSVRETESTNLLAFRLAENSAPEGTVVIAEAQTGGKGRLGRHWESPPGVNLYCSVILRPPMSPVRAPQLTFLSAVAVARAIEEVAQLQPTIKWPNDVLLNGRKVAGLLNEMSAETDTIHCVVLGIGVNINMEREQFPNDLRQPATSLFLEKGVSINRVDFTKALLTSLDVLYDDYLAHGFTGIREEWLARSTVQGRRVRVSFGNGETEGVVSGVDNDGALLITRGDGTQERVLAGDVTVL